MEANEIVTLAAVFVGTGLAAYIGYFRKAPPAPAKQQDSVLASIGAELGNRHQMDQLIAEVKRIGDILSDKNTANITDRLEELADRIDHMQLPPGRSRR